MQDEKYREFHCRLIPGVDKNRVIGIRVPVLRKFAKKYTAQATDEEREAFFRQLPHTYYEENNLHVMWIAMLKDYDMCLLPRPNVLRNTRKNCGQRSGYGSVVEKLTRCVMPWDF